MQTIWRRFHPGIWHLDVLSNAITSSSYGTKDNCFVPIEKASDNKGELAFLYCNFIREMHYPVFLTSTRDVDTTAVNY